MLDVNKFEQQVSFPAESFNAARVYLGILAYPEKGAGQPGGNGAKFAEALWQYVVWNGRKAKGLAYVRNKFNDPEFKPPEKREFSGAVEQGRKRIVQRSVAYSLVGSQLLSGFFSAGREAAHLKAIGKEDEAHLNLGSKTFSPMNPQIYEKATPSIRKLILGNLDHWSTRFALNKTGPSADSDQKAKDVVRRGYKNSLPVMHLMHGLNQVMTEVGPNLDGWEEFDPLLVLLWNPDRWIVEAIELAKSWRTVSKYHYLQKIDPTDLIEII